MILFNVIPDSLYILKIKATRKEDSDIDITNVHINGLIKYKNQCCYTQALQCTLPISSDILSDKKSDDLWYEQTIFYITNELTTEIEVFTENNSVDLHVRLDPFLFIVNTVDIVIKQLEQMKTATFIDVKGRKYNYFLEINNAVKWLEYKRNLYRQKRNDIVLRLTKNNIPVKKNSEILIGLIGNDTFLGMLETYCTVIKITYESCKLIENNIFDLIILQSRSSQLLHFGATVEEEGKFTKELIYALEKTTTPVLELKHDITEKESKLEVLNQKMKQTLPVVYENEVSFFVPLHEDTQQLDTILIPVASDLYQYPQFLKNIHELDKLNIKTIICEANYGHVILRTNEIVNSTNSKTYGTLSPIEIAQLSKQCGFVLFHSETLRNINEIINLVTLTICNGAIPIVIGSNNTYNACDFIVSLNSLSEFYDYVNKHKIDLLHEKEWLSLYRKYREFQNSGKFIPIIESLVFDKSMNSKQDTSAEMICVTKRLENIKIILENFSRQKYKNLTLHIVFNISVDEIEKFNVIQKENSTETIKISMLDQSYNIGYCLNYAIRSSKADIWFKIDDDYYGSNYITDMIYWYEITDADSVGKPSGFVYFEQTNETYFRSHALKQMRTYLKPGKYLCGATLSGRKDRNLPLFSNYYRNSCDSKWLEKLTEENYKVFVADPFNFIINRGDVSKHTWKVKQEDLTKNSLFIAKGNLRGWVDAD